MLRRLSRVWPLRWRFQPERRSDVLALGSYSLLVVLYTWPAIRHLRTLIWGKPGDIVVALWDAYWFERVVHGRAPLHTDLLFYPDGVSLEYHSISWLSCAIAYIPRAIFGPIGGLNSMSLFETWLCAAGMYVLARTVMPGRAGPYLAGVVFAFDPYRMSRAFHHPNLAGTGFIPLVLACLIRTWRYGRARDAWLGAIALLAVLLTGAHLFIMTVVAAALVLVAELGRRVLDRRLGERPFWKVNAHFLVGCLVVVVPFILPFVRSSRALDEAVSVVNRGTSLNLAALFAPGPEQWFGYGPSARDYRHYGEAGSVAYIGLCACPLLALLFVTRDARRAGWVWVLGYLVFLTLAFGPALVAGHRVLVPWMPYQLIADLSPVRAIRYPERFNLVARLFFAVGAGFGVTALEHLTGRRRLWAWAVLPIVSADILALPAPMQPWRESTFFTELGKRSGPGAILDLPLTRQAAKSSMLSQTLHHRPIVGGMIARTPTRAFRYMRSQPLLRVIKGQHPVPFRCGAIDLHAQFRALRSDGIEYVVIRRRHVPERLVQALETYFRVPPTFQDASIEVFALSDLVAWRSPCTGAETKGSTDPSAK